MSGADGGKCQGAILGPMWLKFLAVFGWSAVDTEPSQNTRHHVAATKRLWLGLLTIFCTGNALGQLVPVSESSLSKSAAALSAPSVGHGPGVRQLAELINGIIGYTRWPQPPNPIRICVMGRDDLVLYLQAGATTTRPRPITVQAVTSETSIKINCDVAYVSALPPENARLLLRQTLTSAIVTIGDGAEFCSDGGMFCTDPVGGSADVNSRLRFSANLDVIARSGLRINPQMLLLFKPTREQGL